jgi:chromosome segregation ATPase
MAEPQPDPEQTERLLFLSSQADDKLSTTINELPLSVRRQFQTTEALHALANAESSGRLSPSQTQQLLVASQEASGDLEQRMRALYKCFEEQRDGKAKALSALATDNCFFVRNNAILLRECQEVIAQDTDLQQFYDTAQLQCEALRKQVTNLETERTSLQDHAATADKQQSLLQVQIDHRIRQYNKGQTVVSSLEEQVRQLEGSLDLNRTKLEDEKRRTAEMQTSIGKLEANVGTLEQALSQSNNCLKVHVEHVDIQQATNDTLESQVEELGISLELARREIADNKQKIKSEQDAANGLDSKLKRLEQSLQSTNDCLENEKSLSNAGHASTAALTMRVHQLEHLLKEARQETINENDRHITQEKYLERSLHQSSNSLEAYMDRCNSQRTSIDSLSHENQQLENSLEVANKALEDEKVRSAVTQASVEELRVATKRLETSLHAVSDCLADQSNRCSMHQASVASLTANVCNLEQSLHLTRMDLEKHERHGHDAIANLEAKMQKRKQKLDLTYEDLQEKTMRCVAQQASLFGLNKKIWFLEETNKLRCGDLQKIKQRCSAQQLSIKTQDKLRHELEKALQSSRKNLEDKAQLYSSQHDYIASLKDTGNKVQQSLDSSRRETQEVKNCCATQKTAIAGLKSRLQELEIQLESTRDRLERAEQRRNDPTSGKSYRNLDAWQLEDVVEGNTAGTELAPEDMAADQTSTSQLAIACSAKEGAWPPGEEMLSDTKHSMMVLSVILRYLAPAYDLQSDSESNNKSDLVSNDESNPESDRDTVPEPDNGSTVEARIPNWCSGTRSLQFPDEMKQDRVKHRLPILYEEVCGDTDCEGHDCRGDYVVRCGNRTCLDATQTELLRKLVSDSARNFKEEYTRSSKWLKSTDRANYLGVSDEKTLAGLSLLEQILDSMITPCYPKQRYPVARKSAPPTRTHPELGLRVMKNRVTLYWSKWYRASPTKQALTPDDTPHRANTARKRENDEDPGPDIRRPTKRHAGLSAASSLVMTTVDDTRQRQSDPGRGSEATEPEHVLDKTNKAQKTPWALDIHMPTKMEFLEHIQRSPWARDTCKSARSFVGSLTPAMAVNVISRLATLSENHSVKQVVLQINLKQLNEMLGYLNGQWILPIIESGFTISERHIKSFPKLCFKKSRLDKLLDYPLDSAIIDRRQNELTLGFQPSGQFTVISRKDAPTTARTLRQLFDADTVAAMHVARKRRLETTQPDGGASEVPTSLGRPAKGTAMLGGTRDVRVTHSVDDQESGRLKSQTRRTQSTPAGEKRNHRQADMAHVAAGCSTNGGGKLTKANDQPKDAAKDVFDNFSDMEDLCDAAATSKIHQTAKTRKTTKNSDVTSGARGRSKRTPKPSRRAAEAASAT